MPVLQWRKSLKRWMDGNFPDLSADVIENETDEMSRYLCIDLLVKRMLN